LRHDAAAEQLSATSPTVDLISEPTDRGEIATA
jgi:hypothetical protein